MARVEKMPDGSEVIIDDEQPRDKLREMLKKRRLVHKRGDDPRTGRQRFEDGIRRIVKGGYDYVTGEGDDFDRAMNMLGIKGDGDAPEPRVVDEDFD